MLPLVLTAWAGVCVGSSTLTMKALSVPPPSAMELSDVKLSPTPISDPVQAKVMQFMPVAFSIMFLFFPSGLVLYWLVNNSLQILQQWHMNRMLQKEATLVAARRR